ncbi:hypothetical protein ACM9HF_07450 [Colwellia sp. RE-S-Sl-9]
MSLELEEDTSKRVDTLTQDHINELQQFITDGDRGGFYLHYYELTGEVQALVQAQITTYSGAWGGAAAAGNYLAKSTDPVNYTLTLDEFSNDIVLGTFAAIVNDFNDPNGNGGILNEEQMQTADYEVWRRKGMGNLFPGNIQAPLDDSLALFFSIGTLHAGMASFAVALGKRLNDYNSPRYFHEETSNLEIVYDSFNNHIVFINDKENHHNLNGNEYDADFLDDFWRKSLRASPLVASHDELYLNSVLGGVRQEMWDFIQANQPPGTPFNLLLENPEISLMNVLAQTLYRNLFIHFMPESVSTQFTQVEASASPIIKDPLLLDLDGDGIETVNIDIGVLFDHTADGLKQGTGWVAADDGLLVLDIDGNGAIDSGRELFGDNTLLTDGTNAENGFAALK